MTRKITFIDLAMIAVALLMLFVGPVFSANDAGTNYVGKGAVKSRSVMAEMTACAWRIYSANTVYSFTVPSTLGRWPLSLSVTNTHATANVYLDPTRSTAYNVSGTSGACVSGSTTVTLESTTGLRAGDLIVFPTDDDSNDTRPYVITEVTDSTTVEIADAAIVTDATLAYTIKSMKVAPGSTRSFDVDSGPVSVQSDTALTTVELTLGYQRKG